MLRREPFPHLVLDDVLPAALLAEAVMLWPACDWPHWLAYDTPDQRKRTCRDWAAFPAPVRQLMALMLLLRVPTWLNLEDPAIPDSMLWGAGMCDMRDGDFLGVHLDHDVHARTGLHRVCNAVLFLSDMELPQGGSIQFWGTTLTLAARTIAPQCGRLVCFEASDKSFHGVPELLCPKETVRRALSVYWYGPASSSSKRPKALFL